MRTINLNQSHYLLLCLFATFTLGSCRAFAFITSDTTLSLGVSSNTLTLSNTSQTITSSSTIDFSYNAYYQPLRSAFIMNFTEYASSNIGSLNQIRIGFGLRWYLFGVNGERYIVDSQTDGRLFRPSPFWSLTGGMTTISVPAINKDPGQYFNAVALDWDLRAGVEVPLNRYYYLVTQLSLLSSLPTYNSSTNESIGYQGIGFLIGLKATSF